MAEGEYATAKTSVWWDIENCAVPRGSDPHHIAQNISSALASLGYKGPVSISSFGDTNQIPEPVQQALHSTGISLNHVPAGVKDASDKKILVDMLFWAIDNPPPANYLLVSGDRDFSYALHQLRMRRYNVLLARQPNVSQALDAAAMSVWNWKDLVVGLPPLSESPCTSNVVKDGIPSAELSSKSIPDAASAQPSDFPSSGCKTNQKIYGNGSDGSPNKWKQVRKLPNQNQVQKKIRKKRKMKPPRKNSNFKWPKSVSEFFMNFLADQVRAGMKVDKGFKSSTMSAACKAINQRFPELHVSNSNCVNHYKTLKGQWINFNKVKNLSGASWDEETKTVLMGDEQRATYIASHPWTEPYINRPIEHYEELALICGDDHATGSFARSIGQSARTPELRRHLSFGGPSNPFSGSMENSQDTPSFTPSGSSSRRSGSKRSRGEANDTRAELAANLSQVADTLVEQDWVERLYTSVIEMHEFPRATLEKAFDYLCVHRLEGRKFIVRQRESRFDWLESFISEHSL